MASEIGGETMKHDSQLGGSIARWDARSTREGRRRRERGERRDVSFTGGGRGDSRGHRGIVLSNAHERRRLWFQRCETADADGWISRREQRARGLFPRAHARENARNAPKRGEAEKEEERHAQQTKGLLTRTRTKLHIGY